MHSLLSNHQNHYVQVFYHLQKLIKQKSQVPETKFTQNHELQHNDQRHRFPYNG